MIVVDRICGFINKGRGSWRKYSRNRLAAVGAMILFFMVFVAVFAPFISPYPPLKTRVGERLGPVSPDHPMGTDDLGRDILSGVVYGARTSLIVCFLAGGLAAVIGILVGTISGYFGGRIDEVLMRVTEVFIVIPGIFLILVFVSFFGGSIINVILIIGMLGWTTIARQLRAQYLSIKTQTFVSASKAIGATDREIMFREILPNTAFLIIVNATIGISRAIVYEASVSFLGAGDPSLSSWGQMINNAFPYIREAWWPLVFPSIFLFLTCVSLNFIADGLNDYLNPRSKGR